MASIVVDTPVPMNDDDLDTTKKDLGVAACVSCGFPFHPGDRFCTECGAQRPEMNEHVQAATVPMPTIGLDTILDGKTDVFVTRVDGNRDGIPDFLQQQVLIQQKLPEMVRGKAVLETKPAEQSKLIEDQAVETKAMEAYVSRIAELEAQIAEQSNTIEAKSSKQDELQSKLEAQKVEMEAQATRESELEAKVAEQSKDLQALTFEKAVLETKLADEAKAMEAYVSRIAELEAEIAEQSNTIEEEFQNKLDAQFTSCLMKVEMEAQAIGESEFDLRVSPVFMRKLSHALKAFRTDVPVLKEISGKLRSALAPHVNVEIVKAKANEYKDLLSAKIDENFPELKAKAGQHMKTAEEKYREHAPVVKVKAKEGAIACDDLCYDFWTHPHTVDATKTGPQTTVDMLRDCFAGCLKILPVSVPNAPEGSLSPQLDIESAIITC